MSDKQRDENAVLTSACDLRFQAVRTPIKGTIRCCVQKISAILYCKYMKMLHSAFDWLSFARLRIQR